MTFTFSPMTSPTPDDKSHSSYSNILRMEQRILERYCFHLHKPYPVLYSSVLVYFLKFFSPKSRKQIARQKTERKLNICNIRARMSRKL